MNVLPILLLGGGVAMIATRKKRTGTRAVTATAKPVWHYKVTLEKPWNGGSAFFQAWVQDPKEDMATWIPGPGGAKGFVNKGAAEDAAIEYIKDHGGTPDKSWHSRP